MTAANATPPTGKMAEFDAMLAAATIHQFTLREIRILLHIPTARARGKAQPPSTADVADALGINKPSISRGCRSLVAHELVESIRDPADGRRICLTRTASGEAFVKRIERAAGKTGENADDIEGL